MRYEQRYQKSTQVLRGKIFILVIEEGVFIENWKANFVWNFSSLRFPIMFTFWTRFFLSVCVMTTILTRIIKCRWKMLFLIVSYIYTMSWKTLTWNNQQNKYLSSCYHCYSSCVSLLASLNTDKKANKHKIYFRCWIFSRLSLLSPPPWD